MNYIYFNEKRRLKQSTIDDLYASSSGADVIYIFADFDTILDTDYTVSLMFRRSDSLKIGEVECLREPAPILNPSTNALMPAFSFVLQNDVLGVSGPLQITARYYSSFVDEATGETEDVCMATGMVVATVHDAVPNYAAMKSTVAANLSRRIATLETNRKTATPYLSFETYIYPDGHSILKFIARNNEEINNVEVDMYMSLDGINWQENNGVLTFETLVVDIQSEKQAYTCYAKAQTTGKLMSDTVTITAYL
jgi:hypothetical protein